MTYLDDKIVSLKDLVDNALLEDGSYLVVTENQSLAEDTCYDILHIIENRIGTTYKVRFTSPITICIRPECEIFIVTRNQLFQFARGRTLKSAALLVKDQENILETLLPCFLEFETN